MTTKCRVRPSSLPIVAALLMGAVFLFGCKEIEKVPFKLPELKREAASTLPPAEDIRYPRYDPYKPVYQGSRFWRHRKSVPPQEKIDWKVQHQIELSKLGLEMVTWGALVAVFGIAACLASSIELVDAIGAFVGALGLTSVGFGMGFMWISEIWVWMAYAATIALIIWLAMKFRGRGVSIPRRKTPCKKPAEQVD
jgi:hypothetical protein